MTRNRYFWWMAQKIWPSEELKEEVYRGPFRSSFRWLFGAEFDELTDSFEYILDEMDRVAFVAVNSLDDNRIDDALVMRTRFCSDVDSYFGKNLPVSVLEVLTALACRCDTDIEGDPDYPEFTAPLWFWSMVKALFGDQFDDILGGSELEIRHYTDAICDQLCSFGQIFDHDRRRKADLWMQLNRWLTENFGGNSVI